MSIILRGYQDNDVDNIRNQMIAGHRSILYQLPTGGGKTCIAAHMLKTAAGKGAPSLFIVHRRELVKQTIKAFNKDNIGHGVIANGFYATNRPMVQIAAIQTLKNRMKSIKEPKLIIFDEAHHCASKSWSMVHEAYPNAIIIGITATPERLDGTGLIKWFQVMVNGPSVAWLIENGYLCPYKLYAPSTVNVGGIHTRMGDYAKAELSTAMDKPTITGDAIKHYIKYATGKRAVVFCVSIEHSKHVVAQFNAAGIPAEHIDGETPMDQRDESIRRFADDEIKILSNVDLVGEGFDLPALEVAILLRPTQSLGLYLQQVGRVLRIFPGKTQAIILDHVGNAGRFGLPDDDRQWSLLGREKKKKDEGPKIKLCPECFAALQNWRMECIYCKYVFPREGAREIEEVEGELQEVDLEKIKIERKKEQGQAKNYEDLIELGRKRGYKSPEKWAKYVFDSRKKRNQEDW